MVRNRGARAKKCETKSPGTIWLPNVWESKVFEDFVLTFRFLPARGHRETDFVDFRRHLRRPRTMETIAEFFTSIPHQRFVFYPRTVTGEAILSIFDVIVGAPERWKLEQNALHQFYINDIFWKLM